MCTKNCLRFGFIVLIVSSALAVGWQALAAPAGQESTPVEEAPRPRLAYERPEGVAFHDSGQPAPEAAGPESPAITVPWSKIAFQSFRDLNQWDIYIANESGYNHTQLTWDGAADVRPHLNRGADKIVFSSNRSGNYDIFLMNTDSSGLTQLTFDGQDDYAANWSPDGTRIVFQAYRDGQAEIYVMNADGSGQTRLTWDGDYDGLPAWSPDGSKIAFISRRTGGYRVYTMNPDGSGLVQLSNQAYSENPVWSPDGSQIAYDADGDGDGFQELWLMNADGSNQRVVADGWYNTDVLAGGWSPEGRYVSEVVKTL